MPDSLSLPVVFVLLKGIPSSCQVTLDLSARRVHLVSQALCAAAVELSMSRHILWCFDPQFAIHQPGCQPLEFSITM